MLKYPETLPSLEAPHFVLASPEWLQLIVVVGFLLTLPLLALVWVGSLVFTAQADSSHYALAGIACLVLMASFYPRNWRRWVVFAADRRGIYLSTFSGPFVHVDWTNVGPASIGVAGIGSNRQRTVILSLRVNEETWAALVGGRKRRVNAPADEDGFRPFGIGNAARNVDETLLRIMHLRGASLEK